MIFGNVLTAQKFSFLPEAGFLLSQIDGDKLNGFHKKGILLGIGTHYPLSNSIKLAIKTSYYRQGSTRKNKFDDKLPAGVQLEMNLNTIGLEFSTIFVPAERSIFFGLGLVHHQILNFDYEVVDNVIVGDFRILDPAQVNTSFNNVKFFLGWSFATSYKMTISYESSFSDILNDDFVNIARLRPYMLTFSLSYELNPSKKKKSKKKKLRKSR